jgi:O-antigen/teichoic acid export membrane protein
VFKKTIILTTADAIAKILGLFLAPIFLNFMPKEEFGEYSFIIVIVASLPGFLTLGLHISQIKEFSAENDVTIQRTVFSSTLIFSLIISLILLSFFSVTGVGEYIVGHFLKIDKNIGVKWLLFSFYTISSCIGLVLYSLAITLKNIKTLIFFSLAKIVLINGVSIFLLSVKLSEDTSLSRLLGTTIGDICFNIIFFFFYCRKFWVWEINKKYLRKALKLGSPMIPAGVAVLISSSSDRYFINKYYNSTYVAEYSLAMLCVSPLHMIMTSAQTILSPTVLSFKNDVDAFQHSVRFLFKFSLLLIPIFFIIQAVIFFAKMYYLIPATYEYASTFSLLLSFQTATFIFLQIPYNIFIKHSRTRLVASVSIITALLTILVGYFITPLLGYSGLIISNTFINLFFLIVCFFIAKKITLKSIIV